MVVGMSVGGLAVISVNAASAMTVQQEGHDGNNLVSCGVLSTKQEVIAIAKGFSPCGGKGTATIWARSGATLPVIESMASGVVCSNQGLISTGRRHSPVPSEDVAHRVGTTVYYTRPLAVWGKTCYSAWVGRTEDGYLVAILKGCGNVETTHFPPTQPATPPAKPIVVCYLGTTPEYTIPTGYTVVSGNCVGTVQQTCATDNGSYNSVTGFCTVIVASCSSVTNVNLTGSSNNIIYVTNNGNCNTYVPPVVVTTPPPVIVVTPPPVVVVTPSPPTVTILTQPQEVSISGTTIVGSTPFKADVSGPSGDSLKVVLSAKYGSFQGSPYIFGGGLNQVNTTYYAPSELPPLSTINGVTTNWDTVTVTVYDTTSPLGLSASATVSFQILPPSTSRG
jgi:hypothetical protein